MKSSVKHYYLTEKEATQIGIESHLVSEEHTFQQVFMILHKEAKALKSKLLKSPEKSLC